MEKKKIFKISQSSILVALSSVLSLITIWKMPLGGSITPLSMVPVILVSCMLGIKWGLLSSFTYSIIQLAFGIVMDGILGWGLTTASLIGTIFLDYIIPFTFLGFAGIFAKKGPKGLILGTVMVVVFRFLCHLLSGVIIFDIWCEWDNVWIYSLCYNGTFMLPELIMTVLGVVGLNKLTVFKKMMGFDK